MSPRSAPVTAGQLVLILEAMKMENEFMLLLAGTVTQLAVRKEILSILAILSWLSVSLLWQDFPGREIKWISI